MKHHFLIRLFISLNPLSEPGTKELPLNLQQGDTKLERQSKLEIMELRKSLDWIQDVIFSHVLSCS